MPVATIFESFKSGATVADILVWHPGTTRAEVDAVLHHLIWEMQAPMVRESEPLYPEDAP